MIETTVSTRVTFIIKIIFIIIIIIIIIVLISGINGGGFRYPPQIPSKPAKRFKLEDFKFVKVLGKGSFGKVN